ncbi:MAG: VWA domain-containing protein [bacterium]|nr:VWA domain-containing protein [bacterium]
MLNANSGTYRLALGLSAIIALVSAGTGTADVQCPVDPAVVELDLNPGESHQLQKCVCLDPVPPKIDVVFAMDLTGSMTAELNNLKTEVVNIINTVRAGTGSDVSFGLVSYEDYPHIYDFCGYSNTYSLKDTSPFRVDAPIGSNDTQVEAAVLAMELGSGGDPPESYARVLWESAQPDSGINYRDGSLKILLNFGDSVPHDCDLREGLVGCIIPLNTGVDPGRDELVGTADDIDLHDDALAAMIAENVKLIAVYSGEHQGSAFCAWEHWSELTGGTARAIDSDGSIPGGISLPDLILELVTTAGSEVGEVVMVPDPDCPLDISGSYPGPIDVNQGATVCFDETITVPLDIELCPSSVVCTVSAQADGAEIGTQQVTVNSEQPPVCDAGRPYLAECVGASTSTELDGTGSSDPNAPCDTLTYLWSTDCPGGSFDEATSATPTLTLDSDPGCSLTCNVSLTVSDGSDEASCGTTVTVEDTLAPTITPPQDIAVECHEFVGREGTGVATAADACDLDPDIDFSDQQSAGSCPDEFTITRTWTATDACSRSSSSDQIITVGDSTLPSFDSFPNDAIVQCLQPSDPGTTGTPDGTDNCGETEISYSDVITPGCGNTETITRTWRVEDDCGNAATQDQTITAEDSTGPVVSVGVTSAEPVEVNADCEAVVEFSTTVSDDCGVDPANIAVAARLPKENAILGTLDLDPPIVGDSSVTITGRVGVSALSNCPATVEIVVTAANACGTPADAPVVAVAQVIDTILPFGACGLTREHPGWNNVGFQIDLTGNQPTYWSAHTGHPGPGQSAPPFEILDPPGVGQLPGRLDPDGSGDRVLRGYLVAWATTTDGKEIRWNHLKGDALIVHYERASAWEYNAYAYRALSGATGEETNAVDPGVLKMNGIEYDQNFDVLMLDFYAPGSVGFDGLRPVSLDADITLLPVSVDLRQDNGFGQPPEPVTTKARFDVWNTFELAFSYDRCITCWDEALLSNYHDQGISIFTVDFLQSDKGIARIEGMASGVCPGSVWDPLIGLVSTEFTMTANGRLAGRGAAGMPLQGWGYDDIGMIRYDSDASSNGGGGGGERPGGAESTDAQRSDVQAEANRPTSEGAPAAMLPTQASRLGTAIKGSLLIFPKVELRWNSAGELIQDTFIDLTNDHDDEVRLRLYYINGDPPVEAGPPDCPIS